MTLLLKRLVLNAPLLLALASGLCGCAGRLPSEEGLSSGSQPSLPPDFAAEKAGLPLLPEVQAVPGTGILSLEREEVEVPPRVTRLSPETNPLPPARHSGEARLQALTPVTHAGETALPALKLASSSGKEKKLKEILLAAPDVYALSPHAALLRGSPKRPAAVHCRSTPPSSAAEPDNGVDWKTIIQEASEIFGVDPALLRAVIRTESSFNHHAESGAGAQGAMQVMPATQEALGLIDPFDPRANVYAGAQYLMHMLKQFPTVELALAAYNAGPGAVKKYGGIPPFEETRAYVRRVMNLWQKERLR